MENKEHKSRLRPHLHIYLPAGIVNQMRSMYQERDAIDSCILDHDVKYILDEIAEEEGIPSIELMGVKTSLHPDEKLESRDMIWKWDIILENE